MQKLTFICEGSEDIVVSASPDDTIFEVIMKSGIALDAPCSGNGQCGKCKVTIVSGETESKKSRHVTEEEWNEGIRLACETKAIGDVTIKVPEGAAAYRKGIRTADLSSKKEVEIFNNIKAQIEQAGITFSHSVLNMELTLTPPSNDSTMPDNERLIRAIEGKCNMQNVVLPFEIIPKLPELLRESDFHVNVIAENVEGCINVLSVKPFNQNAVACGLAIDIGTTTVTAVIVDMQNGKILAKGSCGNGQIRYGADVIHRIVRQCEAGGIKRLQDAIITETINPLISTMCASIELDSDCIVKAVIVGNTTMEHLFTGVSADYLRREPYIPAFFKLPAIKSASLGIMMNPLAGITLAPNVGSYVGGDITAGALASMIWNSEETKLFIDLGTNGELVLGNKDFLMTCACSAGPAFEGGDISCGMRATNGAVEGVKIDPKTFEPSLEIIGSDKVAGLCGSGIIDLIGELFDKGLIDGKGKYISGLTDRVSEDNYGIKSYTFAKADISESGADLMLTEVDIDNFIKAKGALFSAIKSLCQMLETHITDVDKIIIAGGIGSAIGVENAIEIGMLPDVATDKFDYIGNSALTGAYCMLLSDQATEKVFSIASNMTYIELSSESKYMEEFVAACFLPHTDLSLFPSRNK